MVPGTPGINLVSWEHTYESFDSLLICFCYDTEFMCVMVHQWFSEQWLCSEREYNGYIVLFLTGIFEAGVSYTVSVYACADDSPKLLKRIEGYAKEKRKQARINI